MGPNTPISSFSPISVNDVADYIIDKFDDGSSDLSTLKLQKLLYYIQSWHLVYFDRNPLFNGDFQAWVHGPVNRMIFDRFKDTHCLYSLVLKKHLHQNYKGLDIPEGHRFLVDAVLQEYGGLSGNQLEMLAHSESPWLNARRGLPTSARCENIISQEDMFSFYRQRITQ